MLGLGKRSWRHCVAHKNTGEAVTAVAGHATPYAGGGSRWPVERRGVPERRRIDGIATALARNAALGLLHVLPWPMRLDPRALG